MNTNVNTVKLTSHQSALLSEEQKVAMFNKAKPSGTKTDWKPYCLRCTTIARMELKDYGFCCRNCKNMIGWDLHPLSDSNPTVSNNYGLFYLSKSKPPSLFG